MDGFGTFVGFTVLPDWLAWDTFGEANGVADLEALRARLHARGGEHDIANGCQRSIVLRTPRTIAVLAGTAAPPTRPHRAGVAP